MKLKKLIVKNFKSLHNCEVELGKFNVLIGANASGKSNLVEVFKLLRKIYVEKESNPFLEWWGYNNVVWQGKEELTITVGMLFDIDGYEVYFETTFSGTGGTFRILKEVIDVKGYVKIEKAGSIVSIAHSEKFVQTFKDVLETAENVAKHHNINEINLIRSDLENLKNIIMERFQLRRLPENLSLMSLVVPFTPQALLINVYFEESQARVNLIGVPENYAFVVSPYLITIDEMDFSVISKFVLEFPEFLKMPPLHGINIEDVKTPKFPRKEVMLEEDASNIVPLLYNIWLREGKLPNEISEPLSMAFPNTRIFSQLTEDGRVMMKIFEGELELAPPSISDGFYKTLSILTAVYLKPPLIIIDEIENSLHPETLELIIDSLRSSGSQIIVTTHSPVVIDMIEPEDVIFVEKVEGETKFKRISEPQKIKKLLQEKGLAFSEGWLYGEIFKD